MPRNASQLCVLMHGMQGVRSSSLLGSIHKKSQSSTGTRVVHAGRFFDAKSLNITFDAQNSGVRALSGASAKNALCIHLNDRGVDAAPMKGL